MPLYSKFIKTRFDDNKMLDVLNYISFKVILSCIVIVNYGYPSFQTRIASLSRTFGAFTMCQLS